MARQLFCVPALSQQCGAVAEIIERYCDFSVCKGIPLKSKFLQSDLFRFNHVCFDSFANVYIGSSDKIKKYDAGWQPIDEFRLRSYKRIHDDDDDDVIIGGLKSMIVTSENKLVIHDCGGYRYRIYSIDGVLQKSYIRNAMWTTKLNLKHNDILNLVQTNYMCRRDYFAEEIQIVRNMFFRTVLHTFPLGGKFKFGPTTSDFVSCVSPCGQIAYVVLCDLNTRQQLLCKLSKGNKIPEPLFDLSSHWHDNSSKICLTPVGHLVVYGRSRIDVFQ